MQAWATVKIIAKGDPWENLAGFVVSVKAGDPRVIGVKLEAAGPLREFDETDLLMVAA